MAVLGGLDPRTAGGLAPAHPERTQDIGRTTPTRIEPRVLPAEPYASLGDHVQAVGDAVAIARAVAPADLVDLVDAAGLRGRGGAGFPTGRKWRTVAQNRSPLEPSTVVVNAAEGEPGTFKDRAIIDRDPYAVLAGAVIAARAVGADSIVVATKASFTRQAERLRRAVAEVDAAGWTAGARIVVVGGPGEYLFGEETALLEVVDGRLPFPRLAPPFRRGIDEIVDHPDESDAASASAAHVELAGPGSATIAAPTLVDNVETLANIPSIVVRGADWYRESGSAESPGTVVCTVSGSTARAGVGEFAMGTPLVDVLDQLGAGPRSGRGYVGVLSGVANSLVSGKALATPLTYEDMRAAGSGLGACGFLVFDEDDDLVAVAAGVARFLAVESCGQCTPCKRDGLALASALARLARSVPDPGDDALLAELLATVADGARCNLASQQQSVVGSVLEACGSVVEAHARGTAAPRDPVLVAPIVELVDGVAELEVAHAQKQPDWSFDAVDSGQWPAERFDDPRAAESHRADDRTRE